MSGTFCQLDMVAPEVRVWILESKRAQHKGLPVRVLLYAAALLISHYKSADINTLQLRLYKFGQGLFA